MTEWIAWSNVVLIEVSVIYKQSFGIVDLRISGSGSVDVSYLKKEDREAESVCSAVKEQEEVRSMLTSTP